MVSGTGVRDFVTASLDFMSPSTMVRLVVSALRAVRRLVSFDGVRTTAGRVRIMCLRGTGRSVRAVHRWPAASERASAESAQPPVAP